MRKIYIVLFSFLMLNCFGQNTPVMSKVTADWCPNCGAWGWDFMEAVREEFNTTPGMVLGVHYSGGLQNETAKWWADNLNSVGQPKFYMGNENVSLNSSNWDDKVQDVVDIAKDAATGTPAVMYTHESILLENGMLEVVVNVTSIKPTSGGAISIGNYVYEDNVIGFQSQQGNDASHPNVLRSTMGPNFEGMTITEPGSYRFTMEISDDWNAEELGLLTVAWEQDASEFVMIGAASVDGISQISSSENLLDSNAFTFADGSDQLTISTTESGNFSLAMNDLQGRALFSTNFEGEAIINKAELISGIYIISIQGEKGTLNRQVFLK